MDDYQLSAEKASKALTQTFSNSFSSAAKLFSKSIRQDIYNIYALVRLADEIVDTYQEDGAKEMLDDLEKDVNQTLYREFSTNIIVFAFSSTAKKYSIGMEIIEPFFASMRTDLTKKTFNEKQYKDYIYGSADVVALMCLKVFTAGDDLQYESLKNGAMALGSAFQKVNFLRDIKDDYETRGRYYFPIGSFEEFNEPTKLEVVADIEKDFMLAKKAIKRLPKKARFATKLAYEYYLKLLSELKFMPAENILKQRVSVRRSFKLALVVRARLLRYVS